MTKRPAKFKFDAYRLYVEGNHPQQAFEKASALNGGISLSGCMTNRSYSSSYMSDDIRGWIRRQLAAGSVEAIQYFEQHQLSKEDV